MVNRNEWCHLWHHRTLNVSCLQAFHALHGYPRHSHDYYVIAVVDSGSQSFVYNGERWFTPADGLILLNPGDVHTGEPLDEHGYVHQAFYPTSEHMERIAEEIGGKVPRFAVPRADDPEMAQQIRGLIAALRDDAPVLEAETRFLLTMAELIRRFGKQTARNLNGGAEHRAVQQAIDYLQAHYAEPISLTELADQVNFSRYYLLRIFRNTVGMPPHRYQETVRVQHAQRLLTEGESLAQVAYQVGFASQSHFTRRFKEIIGLTPGAYARQVCK